MKAGCKIWAYFSHRTGEADRRHLKPGSVVGGDALRANICPSVTPQFKEPPQTSLPRSNPSPTSLTPGVSLQNCNFAFVCTILGFPAVSLNRPHLVLLICVSPVSSTMPALRVVAPINFINTCRSTGHACCLREQKESFSPPAQAALSPRGGGGVGRQRQPVMSQEVAGTEGSGRLKGDRRAFREENCPPSCLWSLPLSWLDPDIDKGWEETAHAQVSRRGDLLSTFVEEENTLSVQIPQLPVPCCGGQTHTS